MAQNYSNLNCQSPRPRFAGGFKAMDHSSRKPIVTTNQRNICGASHTDPWIPSVHPFLGVRLVLVGDIDINRPRISPINSPTISPFWLFHPLCYHFWDALPAAFTAKLLLNIRVALCHCPASALHSALRATALQLPRGAWESSQSWRAFGHSSGEMAAAFEVETSWNIRDTVNGTLVRDGDPLGTPWRSMLEVPNNIYIGPIGIFPWCFSIMATILKLDTFIQPSNLLRWNQLQPNQHTQCLRTLAPVAEFFLAACPASAFSTAVSTEPSSTGTDKLMPLQDKRRRAQHHSACANRRPPKTMVYFTINCWNTSNPEGPCK